MYFHQSVNAGECARMRRHMRNKSCHPVLKTERMRFSLDTNVFEDVICVKFVNKTKILKKNCASNNYI